MKHRRSQAHSFSAGQAEAPRPCDVPGCSEVGAYRAPRGRSELNQFYWFCLEHVRAYNRHWDYCAGMSEREIEAMIRCSSTWERPTWPMGNWSALERDLRARVQREFVDTGFQSNDRSRYQSTGAGRQGADQGGAPSPERRAMQVLQLEEPVSFAEIKARYRDLVKRHHPDVNGGSKSSEEMLKAINQAYTTLKASHDG